MRNKYDKVMMETAKVWSKESYCTRLQVGAVLAKDGRVLSTGYNGTVTGCHNDCEDLVLVTNPDIKVKDLLLHYDDIEEFNPEGREPPTIIRKDSILKFRNIDGDIVFTKTMTVPRDIIFNALNRSINLEDFILNSFESLRSNFRHKTNGFTVHAEQNVITFAAKNGISTNDATLYVTHSPCPDCAKLIAQSGIKRIVYNECYRDESGIEFLKQIPGVYVEQLNLK